MQANGAEMLRLAACFATEQGIEVCALIHDAVLICAPLDRLDADWRRMRACMAKASRIVLDGFELRTDVHLVRYPDRYPDPRGAVMWDRVMRLIADREGASNRRWRDGRPVRPGAASGQSGRPPAKPKRKKWRRHYVHVPWEWVERGQLPTVSTYRLALLLLYEHWRTGGRPIVLSNISALQEGLSRRSKWNALAELEGLGLIRIERAPPKSPRVTPLRLSRDE